jgi:ABC-type transport system substrate-binding protein
VIVRLRKGIRWQNKPPVNGRELVANDVVHHFQRQIGLAEYTGKKSATNALLLNLVEDVQATDNYTVVFKFRFCCKVM